MSGVLVDGIQYERCCACSGWANIVDLGYLPPDDNESMGKDICLKCTNALPQEDLERVEPATGWIPQYDNT